MSVSTAISRFEASRVTRERDRSCLQKVVPHVLEVDGDVDVVEEGTIVLENDRP